jgi:hypothetical protein
MYWIEHRGIENVSESDGMPSLLSVVRFELMPVDYLYNVAQHNAIAKKLPDFNDHYLRGISYHALSNTMKQRLPCQPVKRKATTQPFIPYTWVIPRDDLDKLVGTDKRLMSDQFWFCGYRMVLLITGVVKVNNLRGNQALFTATLTLAEFNLSQQSEFIIQWQATSQSFKPTPLEGIHTFTQKARVSSVCIKYRMDVQLEKSSSNEATINRSGFNPNAFLKQERPSTTPCLSIDVRMNLLECML